MFKLIHNSEQQNGWACFDIAVGLGRSDLVEFALAPHPDDEFKFRTLLAPEIKHAGALAVAYMLQQKKEALEQKNLVADLFAIADGLIDKADKEQLEAQAYSLLTESQDVTLPRYALPICMHTEELREVFLSYMQAHEQMKTAWVACNEALGHIEDHRLSMEDLDQYFTDAEHQQHPAYLPYKEAREKLFAPAEQHLMEYCQRPEIYQQYIKEYYGKRGWVAFQRQFSGESSTSMVDIAALKLQACIIVHDFADHKKILYTTKNRSGKEIHIAFDGHHFVHLEQHAIPTTPPRTMPPTRSTFAEEDYSVSKRPDLLPGLSGSLYQGEVAAYFMLDGLERGLSYEIKVEVGDLAKWDDIKITYDNPKQIVYVQVKHGFGDDPLLLPGNFYNKSGKATRTISTGERLEVNSDVFTLPMYFADWLEWKKTNPGIQASFMLFSNRRLANAKEIPGFTECFAGSPLKLTQEFIQGTGIYIYSSKILMGTQKEQVEFRENLFKSLKSINPDEQLIKDFLSQVIFNLGVENIDRLEQRTRAIIHGRYAHKNADAIYYAFKFEINKWLRSQKGVCSFTNQTVHKMLEDMRDKHLVLEEKIGAADLHFRRINKRIRTLIPRNQDVLKFTAFLDTSEPVHILHSEKESGKTAFSYLYISQQCSQGKLILGEYVYLTAGKLQREDLDILNVKDLKLIIIDSADKLLASDKSQLLQPLLEQATKQGKKLLLICNTVHLMEIYKKIGKEVPSFSLPLLSDEEIAGIIDLYGLRDKSLMVGNKCLALSHAPTCLRHIMRNPVFLSEIIRIASQQHAAIENVSQVFIKPRLVECVPIYSLMDILALRTSACLEYDNFSDGLAQIQEKYIAVPLQMRDILSEYEKDSSFTLTKKISRQESTKKDSLLIINCKDCSLDSVPEVLWKQISQFPRTVIVYAAEQRNTVLKLLPAFIKLRVLETSASDVYCSLIDKTTIAELPNPAKYIEAEQRIEYESLLAGNVDHPVTLLHAEAGAGKTVLAEKLSTTSKVDGFPLVVTIRLPELTQEDNEKDLATFIADKLFAHTDKLSWQKLLVLKALEARELLLVLDGWDELHSYDRSKLDRIVKTLFAYHPLIVATRPNATISLPCQISRSITLKNFGLEDIREYVSKFFGDSKFASKVCVYISTKMEHSMLEVIGVPLQCYLLCKILESDYQKWKMGAKESCFNMEEELTQTRLYQLFIAEMLKQYLVKHEHAPVESNSRAFRRYAVEFERLRRVAFKQLFKTDWVISFDPEIDEDIIHLGICKPTKNPDGSLSYRFNHKTYQEYFAALYLVELLLTDKELARKHILKQRYNPHYKLVWQFMAGIVSCGDQQLRDARQALDAFWEFILTPPHDLTNTAHNRLVLDCLRNSDWIYLQSTSIGKQLAALKKYTQESAVLEVKDKVAAEKAVSSTSASEDEDSKVESLIKQLREPFSFESSSLHQHTSQIGQLARAAKTEANKTKAVEFLLSINTSSFLINAAIAEAFGSLEPATEKVFTTLTGYLSNSHNIVKLRASQSLCKLGYPVDKALIGALVSAGNDYYDKHFTWRSGEALDLLRQLNIDSQELTEVLCQQLTEQVTTSPANPECIKTLYFCLGKIKAYREIIKGQVLKIKINPKYHGYCYLMLCNLGFEHRKKALECIIAHKMYDLISDIPVLAHADTDVALMKNIVEFIISKPDAVSLKALDELLQQKIICINDIKDHLFATLADKDLTASTIEIFKKHGDLAEIIPIFVQCGYQAKNSFWLVDAGIANIDKLIAFLDGDLEKYLHWVMNRHFGWYSVESNLHSMCLKLSHLIAAHPASIQPLLRLVMHYLSLVAEPDYSVITNVASSLPPQLLIENLCQLPLEEIIIKPWLQLLLETAVHNKLALVIDHDRLLVIGENLELNIPLRSELSSAITATISEVQKELIAVKRLEPEIVITSSTAEPTSQAKTSAQLLPPPSLLPAVGTILFANQPPAESTGAQQAQLLKNALT